MQRSGSGDLAMLLVTAVVFTVAGLGCSDANDHDNNPFSGGAGSDAGNPGWGDGDEGTPAAGSSATTYDCPDSTLPDQCCEQCIELHCASEHDDCSAFDLNENGVDDCTDEMRDLRPCLKELQLESPETYEYSSALDLCRPVSDEEAPFAAELFLCIDGSWPGEEPVCLEACFYNFSP